MTIALLDGDIFAFRCAASCEPTKIKPEREPREFAIARLDELLNRVLSECSTSKYRIFLSGSENFRYLIYPDYKANRRDKSVPEYLDACREFLVTEWGASVTTGYEADDALGINATQDFIICSIDKDLMQIPGAHYNFVKNEYKTVDEREAAYSFWSSMLIGDNSDNLAGIDRIGKKTAERILKDLGPSEMEDTVRGLYGDERTFIRSYNLYRILRSEEDYERVMEYVNQQCKEQGEITSEISERQDTREVSGVIQE